MAFGGVGHDDIRVSGDTSVSAWLLWGGDGNDRFKGGGAGDVFMGEAGDDLLVRGGDRDVLSAAPGRIDWSAVPATICSSPAGPRSMSMTRLWTPSCEKGRG